MLGTEEAQEVSKIERIEELYNDLKERRDSGKLSNDEFRSEAQALYDAGKLQYEYKGKKWEFDLIDEKWITWGEDEYDIIEQNPRDYIKQLFSGKRIKQSSPADEGSQSSPQSPPSSPPGSVPGGAKPGRNWRVVIGSVLAVILLVRVLSLVVSVVTPGPGTPGKPMKVVMITETLTSTPIPPTLTIIPTSTPVSPTSMPTPKPTLTDTPVPTNTSAPTPTGTATPTATPTPTFTKPSTDTATESLDSEPEITGKLAYPYYDEEKETFNVVVIDLETGNELCEIKQASQPSLNRDGTKLAYRSWNQSELGLYYQNLITGVKNTISVFTPSQRPQFGPSDNPLFAFVQDDRRELHFSDKPEDGVSGAIGETPTWTPDGSMVVYRAMNGATTGLAIIPVTGGVPRFITDNPGDIAPSVSPDGKTIAFTSSRSDNWDVWLVGIDGGTPIRLTDNPERDGLPVWSPDGNWIAYVSFQRGQWAVWVTTPDGEVNKKLVDIPGGVEGNVKNASDQLGWLHESISWAR